MVARDHKLGRNVRYAVAECLLNLALVFATYRLVILQGGLEAVGLWSGLVAWAALIRIGDLGMASAALRFAAVAEDAAVVRRYLETGVVLNALLFGGLAALACAAAPWLPGVVDGPHAAIFAAVLPPLLLGFWLSNVAATVLAGLQGLHLGYLRSQISVLGTMVQLAAVLVLVPQLHLLGLAWAQVLQHVVTTVLGWAALRRNAGVAAWLPWRIDRRAGAEMLRFGLAGQAAGLGNGLFEPVSKLLMQALGGLPLLGLFELAYKTVSLPRNVVAAAIAAAVPAMSSMVETDRPAAAVMYRRAVALAARSMLVLAAGLTLLAPAVSALWLGHVDGLFCAFVAIVAIGFTFNTIGAPAYTLGIAAGRQAGNLASSWITLALLLLAGGVGALLGGALGLALAVGVSLAAGGLLIRRLNEPLLRGGAESKWAS